MTLSAHSIQNFDIKSLFSRPKLCNWFVCFSNFPNLCLKFLFTYCGKVLTLRRWLSWLDTPSIPEIIWVKNVRAIVVCGFLMKSLKNHILKIWKKLWVPFGSYLLNSTVNPANLSGNGLDWICYSADNSKTISLRTHKPKLPSHFWPILFLV